MAANVADRVLDLGLNVLDTEATHLYICNAEPATYSAATSTNAVGNKNFGAGAVCGSPAAGSPNGRKVTVAAVSSGGTVTSDGATASNWAIVDTANSRLLAVGALASSQTVYTANGFTLAAFDIRLPNQ